MAAGTSIFTSARCALGAVAALGAIAMGLATPATAQGRCGDLWYQRNEIYARNGYCFNTERGRAAFGRGCFAPYGRLSGAEKRRVAEIQDEENYLGCR